METPKKRGLFYEVLRDATHLDSRRCVLFSQTKTLNDGEMGRGGQGWLSMECIYTRSGSVVIHL